VQPDFVVVLKAHADIIHDRRIRGVPDLIIEVLSPNNAVFDQETKREAYALAGLPEYAIVDPRTRTINHYRLETVGRYSVPRVFRETDTATFDCLPSLAVPVAELFSGAPDTTL